MNKVIIFKVKYLGATNHKGSRVVIESHDCSSLNKDKPIKKTLSYDYEFNSSTDIAGHALTKAGFNILGINDVSKSNLSYIVCEWEWDKLCAFFGVKYD